MARRDKYGILPPPPVQRGTVVQLRDNSGRLYNKRAIVLRNMPPSDFSRAYGRQVLICTIHGKKARTYDVTEKGAGDLKPMGVVKKIPKACREALKAYKEDQAPLFAKRKRR